MSDTSSTVTASPLPPLATQAERLIELGVHELARLPADDLRTFAENAGLGDGETLLAVHPD